ncbi:MAG TPA: ABC transporter permease [Longimicrobium sp.]|jgi:predicted permease
MRWTERWRKRLRVLARRDAVERELDEELAFHLEMETQKNLRAGLPPPEARRQAALAFGAVEKYKEEVRDARTFGWVSGASLDFKLGTRLLVRYPGLNLAGGLALAFAMAMSAAIFEGVTQTLHPRIPLHEGDRLVAIITTNLAERRIEDQVASDLEVWRRDLRSVRELGAYALARRNLIIPGGSGEPVAMAEISAAGLRTTRVPPLLGRTLRDEDERPGATAVAVIGHRLWRARFVGDPRVVGRVVQLNGMPHVVVGVMPEDFSFPTTQQLWVPLRRDAVPSLGGGPRLGVFGRLAPGVSIKQAQAELAALSHRGAADGPDMQRQLRSRVISFPDLVFEGQRTAVQMQSYATNAAVLAFLLLVCANVATLVFARTAAREKELVVRTALGATRRRIVLQLFAESLVLAAVAGVVGMAAAAVGLPWAMAVFEAQMGELPFWFHDTLSPRTILYTAFLAVLAAAVAGVVPALKMTGRSGEARLRQAVVGGSSVRFGRLWTGIIVTQVALAAFAAPLIGDAVLDIRELAGAELGVAAGEFLAARATPEGEDLQAGARIHATLAELERRLEADPAVAGVTMAEQLPGTYHPRNWVEVEGLPTPGDEAGNRAQVVAVAPDFFTTLGARIALGRGFMPGDRDARAVVVNEDFVRELAQGRSPVGLRLRYREEEEATPGPWYEVVGVVRQIGMTLDPDLPHAAGIYHSLARDAAAVHLAVRLRGDPAEFAPRLRTLTTAVDPTLQLDAVRPLESVRDQELRAYRFWGGLALGGLGVVLLLTSLGIYSVMAFTVSRRTREIGIRVALGARRRRLLASILARAFGQVGMGIALGILLLLPAAGGIGSIKFAGLLTGSALLVIGASVVACIVPARQALAVQPTEAMRADV